MQAWWTPYQNTQGFTGTTGTGSFVYITPFAYGHSLTMDTAGHVIGFEYAYYLDNYGQGGVNIPPFPPTARTSSSYITYG